jgi:hypothetical protein
MNNPLQSPPKGQPQCDVLTSANTVAFLSDTVARRGADEYLGAGVTMAEDMLQSATCAENAGQPSDIIVVVLLHDIEHFTRAFGTYASDEVVDKHHEVAGADLPSWTSPVPATMPSGVVSRGRFAAVDAFGAGNADGAAQHHQRSAVADDGRREPNWRAKGYCRTGARCAWAVRQVCSAARSRLASACRSFHAMVPLRSTSGRNSQNVRP